VDQRRIVVKTDQEIEQAYDVFVDDEGLLNLVCLGVIKEPESNTRQAQLIQQDVMTILDRDPGREYDMIVNLLPLGKAGYASSRARRTYLQISSHRQIRRFAIVGGSVFVRTMAGFFIRAAGKGEHMKWFADREDAVKWLKEDTEDG
jgi:hypothetical protein